MGCQQSKEEFSRQEEINGLAGSFKSLSGGINTTNRQLSEENNRSRHKKPWSILKRFSGTKYIPPQKPKQSQPGIKAETVNMLRTNSSPEFGFSRVLKTVVTEKPITTGALMNIIVLSEGEGEHDLLIRAFGVKSSSIDYEFSNLLTCRLDWQKPDLNDFSFDPESSELLIWGSKKVLYKVKLNQKGTKPVEVKIKKFKTQAKFLKGVKGFQYHNFRGNKSKHGVYCSKYSELRSLCAEGGSKNPISSNPNGGGDRGHFHSFLISEIKNYSKESPGMIGGGILCCHDIETMLTESLNKFNQNFDLPTQEEPLRINQENCKIKVHIQPVKTGLISVVVQSCFHAFVSLVNIHLKKVVMTRFVSAFELAAAYFELNKNGVEVPGIDGFSNKAEFTEKELDLGFFIRSVHFDYRSLSVLIHLKNDIFVNVNLRTDETDLRRKYHFFDPSTTSKHKSLNIEFFDQRRSNRGRLPELYARDITRWYYPFNSFAHDSDFEDHRADSQKELWKFDSKFYDLKISTLEQAKTPILVVNDQEALILRGEQRIPIDKVSFRFLISKRQYSGKTNLKKIGEEEGLSPSLLYQNSKDDFTLFKIFSDEKGSPSISKALRVNIGSMTRRVDAPPGATNSLWRTCCFKNVVGSISVISVCWKTERDQIELTKLELDGDSLKMRSVWSRRYSSLDFHKIECRALQDSLLVCFPRTYGFYQNRKRIEFELLDKSLQVVDYLKLTYNNFIKREKIQPVDENQWVTAESKECGDVVLTRFWVNKNKKKFEKGMRRVEGCGRLKKACINDKGICLLTSGDRLTAEDLRSQSGKYEVWLNLKLLTFNLELEVTMVVDLGFVDMMKFRRIDYITTKEAHCFKGDFRVIPWFSVEESKSPEKKPIAFKLVSLSN